MAQRTIFSLWLQGIDRSPDIVQLCFRRWESLNPGYDLHVLDEHDVRELLAGTCLALQGIPPQAISDIVRARLLAHTGGIWVDAAVLPLQPLDSWLPERWAAAGFFAFDRPQPDRPLASWFLASTPGHPLMEKWWQQVVRYWSRPRSLVLFNGHHVPPDPVWEVAPDGGAVHARYPYFWYHYLFEYLLKTDPACARQWSLCPKISARAPHALQALFSADAQPSLAALAAAAQAAPVQKLNWRGAYPLNVLEQLPAVVRSDPPSAHRISL